MYAYMCNIESNTKFKLFFRWKNSIIIKALFMKRQINISSNKYSYFNERYDHSEEKFNWNEEGFYSTGVRLIWRYLQLNFIYLQFNQEWNEGRWSGPPLFLENYVSNPRCWLLYNAYICVYSLRNGRLFQFSSHISIMITSIWSYPIT